MFSSCAIHANFPFFCFKKECIVSAWSFQKEAGGKRGIKQKVNIVLAKAKAKKRKKQNSNIDVAKVKVDRSVLDSLITDTSTAKELIKIVFYYKGRSSEKKTENDSIYLRSSFLVLSKNDKSLINFYLNKYLVKNITKIYISSIINTTENTEKSNRLAIIKTKKLVHYFLRTGIKGSRIKTKKE